MARTSNTSSFNPSFTGNENAVSSGQLSLDAGAQSFSQHATDKNNLIAMTAGSFAYRLTQMAALEGLAALGLNRLAPRAVLQGASALFGLGNEVIAFRGTSNALNGNPLSETFERNGFLSSFTDFGMLKIAGQLSSNPLLANFAQSAAMVGGHNATAFMGWTEHDNRPLVERLAEAQATAMALNVGSALFRLASGSRAHHLERSLESRLALLHIQNHLHTFGSANSLTARAAEISVMGAQETPGGERPARSRQSGREENAGRTESVLKGVGRRISSLVPSIDINPLVNPADPIPAVNVRHSAEPIRSTQEGIDRARALGLDQETLTFLRKGAERLEACPEVQAQFFNDAQALFQAQRRLQDALSPILAKLPRPDLKPLNARAKDYLDALDAIEGAGNTHHARYMVLHAQLERLSLETLENYRELSDQQLREMEIEPESIGSIGRNAHTYTDHEIDARLSHPLLRDLPETARLRNAYEQYRCEAESYLLDLQRTEDEVVTPLRARIATTVDISLRASIEQDIKAAVAPFNKQYWDVTSRVNEAMRTFLANPAIARVFLVENAVQTSRRTAVQGMTPRQMADYLKSHEAHLSAEEIALVRTIQETAQALELVAERGYLARVFYGALRIFNKDRHAPQILRGRYERTLTKFIEGVSPSFWALEQPADAALERAVEAKALYFREYYRISDSSRKDFAELEAANEQFWKTMGEEVQSLVLRDMRRQVEHASRFIEAWRDKIGNDFKDRSQRRNESYEAEYTRVKASALEAIEAVNASAKLNSRDLNRKRETALQRIQDLFVFANRMRAREENLFEQGQRFGVLPTGNTQLYQPLSPVSIMAAPYTAKTQARAYNSLLESLRVVAPVVLHTIPIVLGLMNAVRREHSFSTQRHLMAEWASRLSRARGDDYVINPDADQIMELNTSQFVGNHNGWPDFAVGPTPAAGSAYQRKDSRSFSFMQRLRSEHRSPYRGKTSSRHNPLILSKEGLGSLMGPLFSAAIDIVTESVGDSSRKFDKSVTRAARSLVMGDVANANLEPGNTSTYDELTMSVINQIDPFRFAPFDKTSEILCPPQGGRSFRIIDRAMALSSRPQDLLFTVSLNSYPTYPKPDTTLPLRSARITTVTDWLPAHALHWDRDHKPTPAVETIEGSGPTNGNGYAHEPANWERTLWYVMGSVPEYYSPVASVRKLFAPFEKPVSAATEATLEQMFGGAHGVYPNAEASRFLRERIITEAQISYDAAVQATRASQHYDLKLLENRLDRASLEIKAAGKSSASREASKELAGIIRQRKIQLERLNATFRQGLVLSEAESPVWNALRASIHNDHDLARVRETLSASHRMRASLDRNANPKLLQIFDRRIEQLHLALARATVGETLTPVENLLIGEMNAALTEAASGSGDRVIQALRASNLNNDQIANLVKEERIRETTRRLVQRLPGAGRGTIDAVSEHAEDSARVMMDSALGIRVGERSKVATGSVHARFFTAGPIVMFLGLVDRLSFNTFNLFNRFASWNANLVMGGTRWRPEIDTQSIHALEEAQIQGERENRPLVFLSGHTSWLDITTLISIIPYARFTAKDTLAYWPLVGQLIWLGRSTFISKDNPAKARVQLAKAAETMRKYHLATFQFHGGTRSLTGTTAPAKKGGAHLVKGTNAVAVPIALEGLDQVMPNGPEIYTKGLGLHRRIMIRIGNVIPFQHSENPKADIDLFTQESQVGIADQYMKAIQDLHRVAQQGNIMASSQLEQRIALLQPGMDLLNAGKETQARIWAEGEGKKQGMKTDFILLQRINAWWNSVIL